MRTASVPLLFALLLIVPCAAAQQSASWHISSATLNAGGHGTALVDAGGRWRVTTGALGDAVHAADLRGASWRVEGGFISGVRPAVEIRNLLFTTPTTLAWSVDPAAGTYDVYRAPQERLPAYGSCLRSGLTTPEAADDARPVTGRAFCYLVTAVNRLAEEGSLGADSAGRDRRAETPCP